MSKKLCVFPSDPIIEYYKKGEIKQRYFNPNNIFEQIDIITFTDNEIEEEKVKELAGTGKIKIHPVGKISIKNRHKNIEKIVKIVQEIDPDVIRSYNSLLPGWYAAKCASALKIPFYLSLANICIQPFQTNYLTNCILPSKILEYFACKKPVLSTPLKGTKEYLPNENYGIVYAHSEQFVEKLSELITDQKYLEKLGELGYSYVLKNHDWDLLVNQLIVKFEQLTSKK